MKPPLEPPRLFARDLPGSNAGTGGTQTPTYQTLQANHAKARLFVQSKNAIQHEAVIKQPYARWADARPPKKGSKKGLPRFELYKIAQCAIN